eukprot:TRINITY_DN4879_c0_g1_i1.p1 TRINITY_DN4879_c0_g1~~TRINITY_DN4879_c0_g1_i1.p1  ORF type:complete len:376 (+),score=12.27 TRINITY_DN4879_c0_g1_i1:195-1322(+)
MAVPTATFQQIELTKRMRVEAADDRSPNVSELASVLTPCPPLPSVGCFLSDVPPVSVCDNEQDECFASNNTSSIFVVRRAERWPSSPCSILQRSHSSVSLFNLEEPLPAAHSSLPHLVSTSCDVPPAEGSGDNFSGDTNSGHSDDDSLIDDLLGAQCTNDIGHQQHDQPAACSAAACVGSKRKAQWFADDCTTDLPIRATDASGLNDATSASAALPAWVLEALSGEETEAENDLDAVDYVQSARTAASAVSMAGVHVTVSRSSSVKVCDTALSHGPLPANHLSMDDDEAQSAPRCEPAEDIGALLTAELADNVSRGESCEYEGAEAECDMADAMWEEGQCFLTWQVTEENCNTTWDDDVAHQGNVAGPVAVFCSH